MLITFSDSSSVFCSVYFTCLVVILSVNSDMSGWSVVLIYLLVCRVFFISQICILYHFGLSVNLLFLIRSGLQRYSQEVQ